MMGHESPPVFQVAGSRIRVDDAVVHLLNYPSGTVRRYDGLSGSRDHTDDEFLVTTRVVASRLSNKQLSGMVARAQGEAAPWDRILEEADLADVEFEDEVWAAADRLYLHFLDPKLDGVGPAKVHKFLHLKYPALYPVIDSELRRIYRNAQVTITAARSEPNWRQRTWLAVRDDLRANRRAGVFDLLRDGLLSAPEPKRAHAGRVSGVSDLRLLDMLAWRAASRQGSQDEVNGGSA